MDVQTSLEKQEGNLVRAHEAISCPACTRIHFIKMATGTVTGENK